MIRAALIALIFTGCASHNMRDTVAHGDWDRDGCIAVRCKAYCKETATPEQVAAFHAGVIDDEERAQLDRLRLWVAGDTVSTIAALSLCEGVSEVNPLLGPSPNPAAVVALSGIVYALAVHDAKASPYWCSSARPLKTAANIRMVATISNTTIAGVCR